jgi:uncharacterized membrane protein YraQ (UPF0718 family)
MLDVVLGILIECWEILVESAPYVLFGFFAAGILKAYLPEQVVAKHLGKNSTSSVLKASLFGIPLPLCSCGVIPAAIELRKQGASKGASASFLVSVPDDFFLRYMGSEALSLLIMLGVGIPIYICASASTPVAAALVLNGLSPGAALVFLLAGPATNAATLTVVARYFGKHNHGLFGVYSTIFADFRLVD